jgi:hypothetical protein
MRRFPTTFLAPILAASLAACFAADGADDDDYDNDPPLASADELLAGAPKADELPRDYGKFDDLVPVRHDELVAVQSPVRNQASRGVCSIFSTIGLMEHLYIKEGTITDPDFSEQYLQWSAKFEVGSFPRTSGSNANFNLQAISNFGIPSEDVWPYEGTQWSTVQDPDCDGEDNQPTHCYTNGQPTEQMKAAEKFFLPRGRFLHPRDIKGHIQTTGTAIVAGMTFFYQSWNHRKSELPTSRDNWDQGIVLYPNDEDRRLSLETRAGHSIVILGWDDDMEVPIRDAEGNTVLDDAGNEITEKGFYLFKNSWGTSGFGIDHPAGAGYGWISQRYVHEQASIRVTGMPTNVEPPPGGGEGRELSATGAGFEIPDNDPVGASSAVSFAESGPVSEVSVELDISHTFRGDLRVTLEHAGTSVVLHNQEGGGADDLTATFTVSDFDGADVGGDWTLTVSDNARIDVGQVNSWTLRTVIIE